MTTADAQKTSSTLKQPNPGDSLRREVSASQEQEFAATLLAVGGVADRTMVCRTQRRVREQAMEMVANRQRARRGIGLAILGFSMLLLVLTPLVWSGLHFAESWQNFTDSEMQSMYLIGWSFPIALVIVLLGCLRVRTARSIRRNDNRPLASRLNSMVR